jgi:hypothetical protein
MPGANFPPAPYFASPAAAAAGAGVLALLEDEALLLEDEESLEDEPPSFLVELYRSEYQPPPFSTKLERLTTFDSVPAAPHAVHASGVGSEIFCSTSMVFPQLWQEYS